MKGVYLHLKVLFFLKVQTNYMKDYRFLIVREEVGIDRNKID